MKLFDEMEKCFPEMEKHFMERFYEQEWLTFWGLRMNQDEFFAWTFERYFLEENELMHLFRQSGVTIRADMAHELITWFLYDLCARDEIIRADIAPVLQSRRQSRRLVL